MIIIILLISTSGWHIINFEDFVPIDGGLFTRLYIILGHELANYMGETH